MYFGMRMHCQPKVRPCRGMHKQNQCTPFTDQSSTGLSGDFTVDTSETKSVTKSFTEVAQKITWQQQSVRPSAGNDVLTQTSSDVSSTTSTSKTERLETAKEFIQQKTGSPTSQNNTVIIVIVIVGSIVILLLVVVIAVQIRGKQKRRVNMRETISFTRDHSSTYCEIDDRMVPSTADYHLINDNYELLKQNETDRTKYSTLPTRMNEAEKDGYLSPNSRTLQKAGCAENIPLNKGNHERARQSMQDINLHYTALPTKRKATSELISHKTPLANSTINSEYEKESSVRQVKSQQVKEDYSVQLRKTEEKLNTNVLTIPKSVKISTDSYIDMDKGTKLDEYVAMEEHSKRITKHCESEEKFEMTDTYK